MLQKILLYCLCLFLGHQLSAQDALLTAFKNEQGKWGFKEEESGKVVIAPQFTEVRRISYGYAAVRKTGKWGYIDKQGKLIHDYQFDKAGSFSYDETAIVKKDGKWFKITPEDGGRKLNMLGKAYEEDLEKEYNREENAFDPNNWMSLDEEDGMYNEKKDFRASLESAQKGDVEMMRLVADKYMVGVGVQKNEVEAFNWYKKAAAKGEEFSKYMVGAMYLNGIGTPKNIPEGFKIIKKESDNSNVFATHLLGVLYLQGIGTSKNPNEALLLFKKAAEKGNTTSMVALGEMYSLDLGIKKDLKEAFAWYKKAADKENQDGAFMTGRFLYAGEGTTKNIAEAIKYLNWAAKSYADKPEYYNLLAFCRFEQGNFKLAMELLNKAVTIDTKYANGFDSMAEMFLRIGNRTKAIEYYRKAAAMGYKNSIDWLKNNNISATEEKNTKTTGQLNGKEKSNYFSNGRLQSIGTEYNGKRVGEWHFYLAGGELDGIFSYDDEEKLHGKYELYFSNGKLRQAGTYIRTKIDGTVSFYHPNGKLLGTDKYSNGTLISREDFFDENGNRMLSNGSGVFIEYNANGIIVFRCNYLNHCRDGKAQWYHDNGQLAQEGVYKFSETEKPGGLRWEIISSFDKNGKEREKGTLKNGNGTWISFDANGNKTVTEYVNGFKK